MLCVKQESYINFKVIGLTQLEMKNIVEWIAVNCLEPFARNRQQKFFNFFRHASKTSNWGNDFGQNPLSTKPPFAPSLQIRLLQPVLHPTPLPGDQKHVVTPWKCAFL